MKRLALVGVVLTLGACSANQIATATADVATVQAALDAGCAEYAQAVAVANAFGVSSIPQAAVIEGFGAGACVAGKATTALVQKGLADPATQAWLQNLSAMLRALQKKA